MRVLVCSDRVGSAAPAEAGAAVARAFVAAGAGRTQAAVLPLPSTAGDASAVLAEFGRPGELAAAATPEALAQELLVGDTPTAYVDLTVLAGGPTSAPRLLRALGVAEVGAGCGDPALLRSVTTLDLAPLRERLGRRALVAFVSDADASAPLLGLDGVAARDAFARGEAAGSAVPADDGLRALASLLEVEDAPGAGAAGGIGAVLIALGARLATPTGEVAEASGLKNTLPQADLVVAVSDAVTTGNFGGATLLEVARRCSAAALPCLALARDVEIARRELRQHGVEAAHAVGGSVLMVASELEERCAGIARSWTW